MIELWALDHRHQTSFRIHPLHNLLRLRKIHLHRPRLRLRHDISCRLIWQTRSSILMIKNSIDCLQLYSLSENDAVGSFLPQMKDRVSGKQSPFL
jgi:hypothetical protein